MRRLFVLFGCIALLCAATAYAQDTDAILGEWITEKKTSAVEIYRCGDLYCGKVSWLKNPNKKDGTEKTDINNPDESKQDQKIIGLKMFWDFKYKGKGKWAGGKIYDPDNGKTYSCKMTIEGTELKVRGFIGISLLGRTTIWIRKTSNNFEEDI